MATSVNPKRFSRTRACLCVLCGLPAAGKSSLSRSVCHAARRRGWRAAVIPYDELIPGQAFNTREAVEDATLQQARTEWKLHRHAVLQCIEKFLDKQEIPLEFPSGVGIDWAAWERCARALLTSPFSPDRDDAAPLLFLLDDNFYYPSMRYEVFQLARKYSLGFCQVYAQCHLDLCVSRNDNRPCPVPTGVIEEMAKRQERPNPIKNPWEAKSIAVDTADKLTNCDIQKVMELISNALSDPLSPVDDDREQKEADRQRCAASVIHQADQACRRLISEAMKKARETGASSQHMRSLAAHLNESKAQFLQRLRGQFLQDPNFSPGEDVDVDRVVKTAVARFDGERQEIMLKIIQNHSDF
ncbi:L-seryl-tRNA(Sec) kinase-like [Syngnathoides biaculeatus]|uniref:L-seryl-tRNA(Sec) kinase-like n=1 Tax=Syngnathoides biaculeatus TaxID=300417 RepID=UPI002ADD46A5|nr:L-seryl-tRNA(Sec) kinase-like [Syngnathoides biaculeatus]